jgi:heat shock protein HslJ
MLMALPAIAQSTQNPTSPTLEGRWRLVNPDERPTPPVDPQATPITAEFSGGRLFGSGGCNQYTTSYQTNGNQLSVGTIASTRKACLEPIMQEEFRYFTVLQGAQNYTVNTQGLQITYQTAQGTGTLHFIPAPPPEPSSFIIHW